MNREWMLLLDLLCDIVENQNVYSDITSKKLAKLIKEVNGNDGKKV